MEEELIIENLSYTYPGNTEPTLTNINLNIKKGSFTTILGQSGCGKTTLLRLIAGFMEPTAGRIVVAGKDQRGISPDRRGIGVVFQDYALFPHMNVKNNILYGLRIRKTDPSLAEEKVLKTAKDLGLEDLLDRYPDQLSGGQQQRTALARALVLDPKVLLMDEPLSSLDTKLRAKVRQDLKEIQQRLGITTVYVTHDTEEAMYLSDTIAVIDDGTILQTSSPRQLYLNPQSPRIAGFTGKVNIIDNKLVRPEWLALTDTPDSNTITGVVTNISFMGMTTELTIQAKGGHSFSAALPTVQVPALVRGQTVHLKVLLSSFLMKQQ